MTIFLTLFVQAIYPRKLTSHMLSVSYLHLLMDGSVVE